MVKDLKNRDKTIIDLNSYTEKQLNMEMIDLKGFELDYKAIEKITESLAKKYMLIPIKILDENSIIIAMSDPLNIFALEDIEIITQMKPIAVLAKPEDIKDAINTYYGSKKAISIADEFKRELEQKKRRIFRHLNMNNLK